MLINCETRIAGQFSIRSEPFQEDIEKVSTMLKSTGVFHLREIAVACELVRDRLDKGPKSDYSFLFAEAGVSSDNCLPDNILLPGFICYGPIAVTQSSFDIYWIAMAKEFQRHGAGSVLLMDAENRISRSGGTKTYVETSSTKAYEPALAFYLRHGYHISARVPDYYADGDDRLILMKRLAILPGK